MSRVIAAAFATVLAGVFAAVFATGFGGGVAFTGSGLPDTCNQRPAE